MRGGAQSATGKKMDWKKRRRDLREALAEEDEPGRRWGILHPHFHTTFSPRFPDAHSADEAKRVRFSNPQPASPVPEPAPA